MIELYASNREKIQLDDSVALELKKLKRGVITGSIAIKYFKFFDGAKQHYIHRWVYETFVAAIPAGFHIHHKDENPANNQIANLECVDGSKHHSSHMFKRNAKVNKKCIRFIQRPKPFLGTVKYKGKFYSKAFLTETEALQWRADKLKELGVCQ